MNPAIEKSPIFFRQITAVFLLLTWPASSIQKPAAMNITRKPQTKKRNVLSIYATSGETAGAASGAPALRLVENNTKNTNRDVLIKFLKSNEMLFFKILAIIFSPL